MGRTLDPEFEPNAAIRRNAADAHAAADAEERLARRNMFSSLLEMNDFVQRLPGRVNRVARRVADNEIEVRCVVDEDAGCMEGLQKIANRIAIGVVAGRAHHRRGDDDARGDVLPHPRLSRATR